MDLGSTGRVLWHRRTQQLQRLQSHRSRHDDNAAYCYTCRNVAWSAPICVLGTRASCCNTAEQVWRGGGVLYEPNETRILDWVRIPHWKEHQWDGMCSALIVAWAYPVLALAFVWDRTQPILCSRGVRQQPCGMLPNYFGTYSVRFLSYPFTRSLSSSYYVQYFPNNCQNH